MIPEGYGLYRREKTHERGIEIMQVDYPDGRTEFIFGRKPKPAAKRKK